jgi:hypothetical protein
MLLTNMPPTTPSFVLQKVKQHAEHKKHMANVQNRAEPPPVQMLPLQVTLTDEETLYSRTIATVFIMATEQIPNRKMGALLKLQKFNGAIISFDHSSFSACIPMWLEAITRVLKREQRKLVANSAVLALFPDGVPFSLMADGSSDRSKKEREAIVVRYLGLDGKPVDDFYGLGTLDLRTSADRRSPDADCITSCYLKMLREMESFYIVGDDVLIGVPPPTPGVPAAPPTPFINRGKVELSLIAGSFDGASVMLGKHGGVSKKLEEIVPHFRALHAAAHVLQCALADSLAECAYYEEWKKTVQDVYNFYHASGKKQFGLEEIAKDLGLHLYKLGTTHGIRWAASQERCIRALLADLEAIALDLENVAKLDCKVDVSTFTAANQVRKSRVQTLVILIIYPTLTCTLHIGAPLTQYHAYLHPVHWSNVHESIRKRERW